MLRIITLAALFNTSNVAAFYDSTTPIVAMKDYSKDYRTLDCTQCIQAEGKMCGKADGSSVISVSGSSNQGHGICCKPDNVTDKHCKSVGDYICSQPILAADNDAKWKDIMSNGKNMQMIAYCPQIKPSTCGLTGTDHKIEVTEETATKVGPLALKTKNGTTKSGLYDACYWELTAPGATAGNSIKITITKAKNMESYLYGGATRADATTSAVGMNAKLVAGQSYYVNAESGLLLTALPVLDATDTEFEFEHSVTKTPPPSGDNMGMIIGIVVGVVAVLIILCAVMKIRQNKKDNTVQVLAQESLDEQPQNIADKTDNDDTNTINLVETNKQDGDK